VGEKWGEKLRKIRPKDDPKNGVKNGVIFLEKYALERGDFLGAKF